METASQSEMFDEDCLSLDTEDLLSFSYQVAKGMEFLASKNVRIKFTAIVQKTKQSRLPQMIYVQRGSCFHSRRVNASKTQVGACHLKNVLLSGERILKPSSSVGILAFVTKCEEFRTKTCVLHVGG